MEIVIAAKVSFTALAVVLGIVAITAVVTRHLCLMALEKDDLESKLFLVWPLVVLGMLPWYAWPRKEVIVLNRSHLVTSHNSEMVPTASVVEFVLRSPTAVEVQKVGIEGLFPRPFLFARTFRRDSYVPLAVHVPPQELPNLLNLLSSHLELLSRPLAVDAPKGSPTLGELQGLVPPGGDMVRGGTERSEVEGGKAPTESHKDAPSLTDDEKNDGNEGGVSQNG